MEKRYYDNFEEDERESRTFEQIKDAYSKMRTILKKAGLTIYIAGGSVPYILLNQDSGRLHDDIDSVCRMEDMQRLRQIFNQVGLYNSEWDSMTYANDGQDYGFEMKVDGVPVGIYPFTYKDGIVTQYTYDPYNHHCKIKEFPVQELGDYICTYTGLNGQSYDTMSLEYIKLSKDRAGRPKDIVDSQKIIEFGYRQDVIDRIALPIETQNIRAEKLQKNKRGGENMEFDTDDEIKIDTKRHTQQTIQELKNVLENCTDAKTKNQILRKIIELEEHYRSGMPMKYLGRGQNSVVFALNNIVLKFGRPQVIKHPLCLEDIESLPFSKDKVFRIIPRMDTSDITEEDTQYIYNQLRKSGLIWTDAHSGNVGRIPGSGDSKAGLRIIDDECIQEMPQYLSAFDVLASDRTDMLIREYYYQKSINPKFKLSDIKNIMKNNGKIQVDPCNPLIDRYNLHLRKSELKTSSAVIAHLKCQLWNEKHKDDNVEMINMPGYYPKLYRVCDENGEILQITRHNPMIKQQLKRTFDKIKGFFSPDKTLKLPSTSQSVSSMSTDKERFIRDIRYRDEDSQIRTDSGPKPLDVIYEGFETRSSEKTHEDHESR